MVEFLKRTFDLYADVIAFESGKIQPIRGKSFLLIIMHFLPECHSLPNRMFAKLRKILMVN
jgi:hypothetical protein